MDHIHPLTTIETPPVSTSTQSLSLTFQGATQEQNCNHNDNFLKEHWHVTENPIQCGIVFLCPTDTLQHRVVSFLGDSAPKGETLLLRFLSRFHFCRFTTRLFHFGNFYPFNPVSSFLFNTVIRSELQLACLLYFI